MAVARTVRCTSALDFDRDGSARRELGIVPLAHRAIAFTYSTQRFLLPEDTPELPDVAAPDSVRAAAHRAPAGFNPVRHVLFVDVSEVEHRFSSILGHASMLVAMLAADWAAATRTEAQPEA